MLSCHPRPVSRDHGLCIATNMGLFDFESPPVSLAVPRLGAFRITAGLGRRSPVAKRSRQQILATAAAGADAIKPFSLTESLYDESTFNGRLQGIMSQLDPLKLFISKSTIKEKIKLLEDFAAGKRDPSVTDAELWEAKAIKAARCHPDTGEIIFLPLCFAAYMPMQPMIVMGMLWPGSGMVNQMFWQWYNQSFNAAVVYANKNKSSEMNSMELAVSYTAALLGAVGISVGMKKLSKTRPNSMFLRLGAPFCAVVFGGCSSLICMRFDELQQGVLVRDEHGNEHGMSKVAAQTGIAKCCFARFLWNIPVLAVCPVLMDQYYKTKFHAANPRLRLLVELVASTACICIGIYPAQAVFSQAAEIKASALEEEFHNKVDPTTGQLVETYIYNKGL